jgi:hypothetical protein
MIAAKGAARQIAAGVEAWRRMSSIDQIPSSSGERLALSQRSSAARANCLRNAKTPGENHACNNLDRGADPDADRRFANLAA